MKKQRALQVLAGSLALLVGPASAGQLDDLISSMKSATPPAISSAQATAAYQADRAASTQSFHEGLAGLYLQEIKFAIADPQQNGGWPYRSFLLDRFILEEDGTALRGYLTDALKERFAAKPEPILAYALVCPALFAGDEALLTQAQAYLKEHDPFLFKLEQSEEAGWRSNIKSMLAREEKARVAVRVARLADLLAQYGHDVTLDQLLTTTLGLTTAGQSLTVRQLGVEKKDALSHAYMRTPDGGFLLFTVSSTGTRAFRANAAKELVAAIDRKSREAPTPIPDADAKKELEAEFTYWSSIADQ